MVKRRRAVVVVWTIDRRKPKTIDGYDKIQLIFRAFWFCFSFERRLSSMHLVDSFVFILHLQEHHIDRNKTNGWKKTVWFAEILCYYLLKKKRLEHFRRNGRVERRISSEFHFGSEIRLNNCFIQSPENIIWNWQFLRLQKWIIKFFSFINFLRVAKIIKETQRFFWIIQMKMKCQTLISKNKCNLFYSVVFLTVSLISSLRFHAFVFQRKKKYRYLVWFLS